MQPTDKSVAPYEQLHKTIQELRESIKGVLDSLPKLPQVDSVLVLSNVPNQLYRHKRRYSLIFLSQPANLAISIPGLGQFPLTLDAGWTELSMPSDTEVALVEGSMSALYRCIDTLE